MKILITVCLVLILFACGSKPPPETQYFVLTPSTQTNASLINEHNNVVLLNPIRLAEFLDQPGIVMQTDTHQIKVAHYHRWAEPLKRNMHRFIRETLNVKLTDYIVLDKIRSDENVSKKSLLISVNQFNGITDGSAVLAGEWVLIDESTKSVLNKEAFHFKASIENDGYKELVNQLAVLLEQFCSEIAQTI